MYHRLILTSLIFLLIIIAQGCGLPGRWETESIKPQTAKNALLFLSDEFFANQFDSATLTISPDNRYRAEILFGDRELRRSGKWKEEGKIIYFEDDKGYRREFDYELKHWDNTLVIIERIYGIPVSLSFKRTGLPNH